MPTISEQIKQYDVDKVKSILGKVGVTNFIDNNEGFRIKTICHNENLNKADFNLQYFKKTHLFYCFSECQKAFNLFGLIKIRLELEGRFNYPLLYSILELHSIGQNILIEEKIKPNFLKTRARPQLNLPEIKSAVMSKYQLYCPKEWEQEDITLEILKKYNVKYDNLESKMIIPHHNSKGKLVGIRDRYLDNSVREAKYMPLICENIIFSHPLGMNLYGLYENLDFIKKERFCLIFEGEKSTYKAMNYGFPSIAVCGSNITDAQAYLLFNYTHINEAIICFDKEEDQNNKYLNKLIQLCKKHNQYFNTSLVFDTENFLELKDSPVDQGKKIFEKLFQKRTRIV